MNFNFRKIASAASSLLMVGATIGAAAAAYYPEPFLKGTNANVAIVTGESATFDSAAATALQSDLSTRYTANGGGSSMGNVSAPSGGDFVEIQKSSDKLNLGNTMSGVFGSTVDKEDMPNLLADGTYMNQQNTEYNYEQRITLQPLTMSYFTDSDYENEQPSVGFDVASGAALLNYSLDFTTDAESAVSSGGDLTDFETTDLNIMGKKFYVLDAKNGTNANYFGKFTLLDAANTVTVAEGAPQTITVGGKSYTAEIGYITSSSVRLKINGQLTNSLAEGETYKLSDGTYVGVKDILFDARDGTTSSVEFSIGSGKIEITSGSDVQVNDETVDGLKGWFVRGTPSGGTQLLDKIIIQWTANEESFIAPKSELTMPAIGGAKLSMTGFVVPSPESTKVSYSGDDNIQLTVPFKDGEKTFSILQANSTGEYTLIGDSATKRLATSNESTLTYFETVNSDNYDTMFVATYASTTDAQSYLLSAAVSENDGRNRTTIRNLVTGDDVCKDKVAGDTCDIGDVSLTVSQVYKTGTAKNVTFTAGTGTSFNTIYTKEGMKIYLPYDVGIGGSTAGKGAIDFNTSTSTAGHSSSSFYVFFDEENKDGDKGAGTSFNVTVDDDSDGKVQVSSVNTGQSNLDIPDNSDDTTSMVSSDLASKVDYVVTSNRGKAEITYSGEQAYGEAFLSAEGTTTSTTGTSGALGNLIVSDSQVSTVSSKNLIVLGGSCINTAARKLIDSAATNPICGADFTAKTGVQPGQFIVKAYNSPWSNGKVALLVAGYEQQDTSNAATWLRTNAQVDTTINTKYVGTSATSANLA